MNMRKVLGSVGLFVLIPLAVTVLGGYIVERIKGTPPGDIAAAIWHPFGVVISGTSSWLAAPVQLSHLGVLALLAILTWLAVSLLRLRRQLNRVDDRVFYTSLGDLTDQITNLQELKRKAEGESQEEPDPKAKVAEGFDPNRIQKIAAKVLIDRYPRRLQTVRVPAVSAKFCERVCAHREARFPHGPLVDSV
jgi:hypothetical protein